MDLTHKQIVERALALAAPSYTDRTNIVANVGATLASQYNEHALLQAETIVGTKNSTYLRERWAKFTKDMYNGRQLPYLDRMDQEEMNDFLNRRGKQTVPFTSMVINAITAAYDSKTKRFPEAAEEEIAEDYETWIKDNGIDGEIKESSRMLSLLGNGAILLSWDELFQDIKYNWISAEYIRLVENPHNYNEPHAVVIRWQVTDQDGATKEAATIYTKEEIIPMYDGQPDKTLIDQAVANGFEQSTMGYKNPYRIVINGVETGFIPLVLCRYRKSYDGSWFCEGEGQSIADFNAEINNYLSTIANSFYLQGFTPIMSVNYHDQHGKDAVPPWGPGAIINFTISQAGQQAGISTVPLDSHITENTEYVKNLINTQLSNRRIPESLLHATADASGVSIVASSAGMQEIREEEKLTWKPIESAIFRTFAVIYAYHNNKSTQNWEDLSLGIIWSEHAEKYTPEVAMQMAKEHLALGIISEIDIVLEMMGDKFCFYDSEEDRRAAVLDYLATIKAERKTIDALFERNKEAEPMDEEADADSEYSDGISV